MKTYLYKQYEMPFCKGIAIITLYVDVVPREEWKDPLEFASGADFIARGERGILMRDIVTQEDHYCDFNILSEAFPDLDISTCGFQGGSGVIAKEGHPFDRQQFQEFKQRQNLLSPNQ